MLPKRASAKADFALLANNFEPQYNAIFCGPATAAIVLNTIHSGSGQVPRDRSRLSKEDLRHVPEIFDPAIARFTQDTVIGKGGKTRAQVFGEPVILNGKERKDFGYQLPQLDDLLKAHGLYTRLVIVDAVKSENDIRQELAGNLQRPSDYVIVNYRRDALGQRGGGHISPLGAYDVASDSFLVLDVNPAAAGWVWIPTALLVKAMRTFDTVENRGYIIVESRQ